MNKIKKFLSVLLCAAFILSAAAVFELLPGTDAASGKWVSSWTTSAVNGSLDLGSIVSGAAFQDIIPAKSTIRTELTVTTSGTKLRFKFTNEYGGTDISLSEVSVAKTSGANKTEIVDGTQTPVTFNGGETSVTVKAGSVVWSDEINFETEAMEKISVSVFFNNATYIMTGGLSNAHTYLDTSNILNFITGKSHINDVSLASSNEIKISSGDITYHVTPFLCNVDSYSTEKNACTAVFIGDSTLVNDSYLYFAEKLVKSGVTNVAVVNESIIANKLLSDASGVIGNLYGDSMLSRFERDALSLSGVKYIFVKIGLNDIIHQYSASLSPTTLKCSTDDIIAGYKKLVDAAHAKGIKIYFFSKSSWKGYEREFLGQTGDLSWNMEAQQKCDVLDEWIKTNKSTDGYIDVSPLSNPADTYALCPSLTLDGAHFTDLGAIALADLIPLEYVGGKTSGAKTAAQLHNVNPYAEKNQILNQMNAAKETTTKKQENVTSSQTPTTNAPQTTTGVTPENTTAVTPENTTAFIQESTTLITEESTTISQYPGIIVPETEATVPYEDTDTTTTMQTPNNQNTSFTPSGTTSTDTTTIGNGVPIGFMLVFFFVVIIAGVVVIITISRRKAEEKELL